MKNFKLLYFCTSLLLMSNLTYAQDLVTVYRTKTGRILSVHQKDSIARLGFPIGEVDLTMDGDTTFIDIEIYPKPPKGGSEFVQKYKNKKLPSFRLESLDGEIIDNETIKGRVVMVNFWSTTCAPCITEMPQLNELKKLHREVVFLAPAPEDKAKVKRLLSKHNFDFIILPGAGSLFKEWGVDGYPKNFFVDQTGVIREVKEGTPMYRKNDKWQVAVERIYSPILTGLLNNEPQ